MGRALTALMLVVLLAYAPAVCVKLANAPYLATADVAPLVGLLGGVVFVLGFLRLARFGGDRAMLLLALLLTSIGVVMQYRIGTFKNSAGVELYTPGICSASTCASKQRRQLTLAWRL